jgi:hypothetical protein
MRVGLPKAPGEHQVAGGVGLTEPGAERNGMSRCNIEAVVAPLFLPEPYPW